MIKTAISLPEQGSALPFDPTRIDHLRSSSNGSAIALLAPRDDTTGALLALLQAAQHSILISIYGYTLEAATTCIIAKHQAGLDVKMLLDYTQSNGRSEKAQIAKLKAAGVPHWIGTSSTAHAILHAKIAVVDGLLVEDGSWNYSASAAKQFNTMDIRNQPDRATAFTDFIGQLITWVTANEPQYQV